MALARAQLARIRQRFLRGQLPPLGHLLVRDHLPVPGGDEPELPWVLVTAWPVPSQLRGRWLNDAVHPALAHVRMGRPATVPANRVVDWAVVSPDGELAEGGWTLPPTAQPADAARPQA